MRALFVLLSLVSGALLAGAAGAQQGPPLPQPANGAKVHVVASGLPLPVALAVGKATVFVGAFGSEDGKTPGGLYAARGGAVRQIASGMFLGLTWHAGTLYASRFDPPRRSTILAFTAWNGRSFAKRAALRHARVGFLGLAVGSDGRLYAGGGTEDCDLCRQKSPYAQAVLSMRRDGSDLRVVARGLRQPFGIAFAKGVRHPFATVEGREGLGRKQPPDYIVLARPGEDYGFKRCTWAKPAACVGFAKPLALLPAHSSPTGIAAIGDRLYVGMFGGTRGPAVWRLPVGGGAPKEVVSGFAAPVVGVTASGRTLFVSDLTGTVYRMPAP
jgi:glucose/arabinose dehydrogenase